LIDETDTNTRRDLVPRIARFDVDPTDRINIQRAFKYFNTKEKPTAGHRNQYVSGAFRGECRLVSEALEGRARGGIFIGMTRYGDYGEKGCGRSIGPKAQKETLYPRNI